MIFHLGRPVYVSQYETVENKKVLKRTGVQFNCIHKNIFIFKCIFFLFMFIILYFAIKAEIVKPFDMKL